MCRQGLRHEQQSARILVKAMHDSGPRQLRQLRGMVQQPVHQGSAGISRSGMDDQARGFVDDQQVIVFVDDIDGDRLRKARHSRFGDNREFHEFALLHGVPGLPADATHRHPALQDPLLQAAPRVVRKHPGKRQVQTLPVELSGNGPGQTFCWFRIVHAAISAVSGQSGPGGRIAVYGILQHLARFGTSRRQASTPGSS